MSPTHRNRNEEIADALFVATCHLTIYPDLPATHMVNAVWHEADETAAIDIHVDYRGGFAALIAWAESLHGAVTTVRRCPQGSTELAATVLGAGHPIKVWMHLHRTQRTLLWANLPGGEPETGATVDVPIQLLRKLAVAEADIAEAVAAADIAEATKAAEVAAA